MYRFLKTYKDKWYDIRDKNLPTACKQFQWQPASKEKHSYGKFRIFSLESKYLDTWNKSCNVSEPKQ